jgi:2-haloacid dehalogenase
MPLTLGFDVFGTLIDTHGVVVELEQMIGDEARQFSQLWREKQLEYTFRRASMKQYKNFGICTKDALNYTSQFLGYSLNDKQKIQLLAAYSTLPAFVDAAPGLEQVRIAGHRLFAFSNGQASAVDAVLTHAGIRKYFEGIISVDSIGTFKPDPATYHHFLESTDSTAKNSWLVSSNGFDVTGAIATGMNAAWVQRSKSQIFDPWEFQPTTTISTLTELEVGLTRVSG